MADKTTIEYLEDGRPHAEVKAGVLTSHEDLDDATIIPQFDAHEERRIIRKIDVRLLPVLAVLYLCSYLDRSNIGNAKIAGMYEDLELYGLRYNTVVAVFFVTYALFEVPSNIMLKIVRPSIWLAILSFSWGTVMTLMGVVQSYHGMVAARFFFGLTEAGFFPAATYLLSLWYKRYEMQTRMALFYSAASLAGAFSGLLAFAIEKMDGVAGLAAWRWIFILEGLVPVAISFTLYWVLPDSPATARFLTKEERLFATNRLNINTIVGHAQAINSDKIGMRHIKAAFGDWKMWLAIIPYWSCSIGTYGFTATAPTAIEQLGYTSAHAQLMTIPIYAFALIVTLILSVWADRHKQRTPFIMIGVVMGLIGFLGELAVPHPRLPGLTYFFFFFIAAGVYAPLPSLITFISNNTAPSSKRAVGMALLIGMGALGGICGGNIFLAKQAPKYPVGYGVPLGVSIAGLISTWILRTAYAKENKAKEALLRSEGEESLRQRYTPQELLDLGDKSPFYQYTL
ncbi:uncharacterized protein Z520_01383 [Fonsecaea multimorphosa CBS 102226]|uniref:Major facilitator superfamily (MFS) profile domain-containing protein n=1 Tax=Fonsecaea multimorphosa CBS 102226 TaxID=1442371 RepID=A0A0D2KA82_9EURO|nr:uncharacterized protein Z520_01383 [Fonsecaea multimorphosa CBS 102226]KIY02918.1 hypothetical protein Z520_01383 [Fonsecaea multimorphosa CBS 102226]OAL30752.1 hypothetical protein AYO22_01372 [Fonsecaea multimorphosa]